MGVYKRSLFDRAGHQSLLLRIYLSVVLFFRVFFSNTPHGVQGCLPPELFPSPPPRGWSIGFMATPRTVGLQPNHRFFPAFPKEIFSCSKLLIVQMGRKTH